MAISAKMYGQMLQKALHKEIDYSSDTIKVALVTNAYTPNQDTDDYWNDVNTNEVANGNGYTTGGIALANKVNSYNASTNIIKLSGDAVSWSNATITARYAVIYDDTPATAATKPLLGYVDFGADQSSSSGNFTITWDTAGIFQITVS